MAHCPECLQHVRRSDCADNRSNCAKHDHGVFGQLGRYFTTSVMVTEPTLVCWRGTRNGCAYLLRHLSYSSTRLQFALSGWNVLRECVLPHTVCSDCIHIVIRVKYSGRWKLSLLSTAGLFNQNLGTAISRLVWWIRERYQPYEIHPKRTSDPRVLHPSMVSGHMLSPVGDQLHCRTPLPLAHIRKMDHTQADEEMGDYSTNKRMGGREKTIAPGRLSAAR